MKKLLNDVQALVPEMLTGLVALNPRLALLDGGHIVVRADARDAAAVAQVAVVSGGGAGHEPAHGGYVGPGMLSAAVAGEVFTSPSTDAVLDAIRSVAGPRGVLLIVKNYTGDRLNFGLAAEIARSEGVDVDLVVVADDVALSADGPHAGRRGLAGTVLISKIAGALAAAGRPLAEVAQAARSAAAALGTMGVALSSCTVPAAGRPGFELGEDEVEWGLGIHGEPGVRRAPLEPADELVAHLLGQIVDELGLGRASRVALLVNNLGSTPVSEISVVAGSAMRYLESRGIAVERAWSGSFLTALDMAGCSLSLLGVDDERLAWLDAPAQTSAWPAQLGHVGSLRVRSVPDARPAAVATANLSPSSPLRVAIESACGSLLAAADVLTEIDAQVGDGDLGISLSRAATAILDELDSYPPDTESGQIFRTMSATVQRVVGGTSGPLYAVMLLRAAAVLEESKRPTASDWSRAFTQAVDGVRRLGGAQPGDRTMVDALWPAAEAFAVALHDGAEARSALASAVSAARSGAAATAQMKARLGRTSYVGDRAQGIPDPGAHAVAIWLAAI